MAEWAHRDNSVQCHRRLGGSVYKFASHSVVCTRNCFLSDPPNFGRQRVRGNEWLRNHSALTTAWIDWSVDLRLLRAHSTNRKQSTDTADYHAQ